jgi:PAS domain S-box-containing protein
LVENRKRLGAILETASEGIVTISDKGIIEAVNPAAEAIFGYTAAEMVGRPPHMLLPGQHEFPAPTNNQTYELQGRRKNESIFPMDIAFTEVLLDDRKLGIACVRDASERKRAEQLSREFAGRVLQAQEAERARLARELHDDITQRLAQLAAETAIAKQYAEPGQNDISRTVVDGLRSLSEDVHSLAYRLHPAILEHLGLEAGLRAECDRFSQHESIAVNVTIEDLTSPIPNEIAFCVFRIAQESLNNVKRHAKANSAEVYLRQGDGGLQLSVSDNGSGFNLVSARLKPSLGLASMEERVRLLGGRFAIQSEPGHGTRVLVWLPVVENVRYVDVAGVTSAGMQH